jgi:hypothetical protein
VIGNHDLDNSSDKAFIANSILPAHQNIVRFGPDVTGTSINYYFDHKNVRMIVIDQYSSFWRSTGWVDTLDNIISNAANADHVFLSFHQPAFPRNRHASSEPYSFRDGARKALWDMLLSHNGKVKATFVGHTHYYSRMQVLNAESSCAKDVNCFPNEDGGIYQIDCGAAGVGTSPALVWIQVDGSNLTFVAKQKPSGGSWKIIDLWEIKGEGPVDVAGPNISKSHGAPGLNVYPNPFATSVDIDISIENGKFQISNFKFEICNIRGQQVFSKSFSASPGARWYAQDHPNGVYIVKATTGTQTLTKRITLLR